MNRVEDGYAVDGESLDTGDRELVEVIHSRRSIRRYRADAIPRPVILQVLEAATWAPSAHNRQPWRFAIVEQAEQKVLLARAMGDRLRQDLEGDGVSAAVIEADVARSYQRITLAPVLIVLCLSMVDMDVYSNDTRNTNEFVMAVQSVAMAGQNLLLAAESLGLGACWMCAPLFCQDVVRTTLGLAADWQPQALLTMGYPAETREKTRRPLETSLIWL
jgi:coenzyme F420-0:L-glutamate ligase / coenzyme F420-1:gamma-L-glutamate ligase